MRQKLPNVSGTGPSNSYVTHIRYSISELFREILYALQDLGGTYIPCVAM